MRNVLFATLLFVSVPAFSDVFQINEFSGLNTDANTATLQKGQTPDSQNVVTDLGSIQGRKGFIRFSTQSAVDIFQFPLSNGTRYLIKRSGGYLLADTGLGTFSTVVSTIPSDRKTVASVLGDKFYFSNSLDGLKYWNGTSVVVASPTLTFTMLATHKGRLWGAGIGGEERNLRGSKLYDGTSWTPPVNPSDDDAVILQVSGALDENIQAIYASFQDKLIVFKKSSFLGLFGSRRSNFQLRSFSETVGVAAPETIQDCDGVLRWLGNNRKVWEFDGTNYKKISDNVNNFFAQIQQGDATTRSATLTSQSDWDQGSSSPSGTHSTTLLSGSVVPSTTAVSSFIDTSSANFAGGTLVNLSTTAVDGSLILGINTGSKSVRDNYLGSFTGGLSSGGGQQFTAGSDYFIVSITMEVSKTFSGGDYTVSLYSDSSNTIGSQLASGTLLDSSVTTSRSNVEVTLNTPIHLTNGTKYWIKFDGSGYMSWAGALGSYSEYCYSGGFYIQNFRANFATNGEDYQTSGSIVSRTYNTGFSTNSWTFSLSTITATMTLPAGTTVTFQTQTSPDNVTFSSLAPVAINAVSTSPAAQYIRYKASFSTNYSSQTPQIDDLTLFIKSSSVYTTKIISVGSNISSWGPVTIGNETSSDGIQIFQIGSTTTNSAAAISNWTNILNNAVPTISTNPFVAFRSHFITTHGTNTVILNDLTLAWTEGSTIRSASGYTDQRYWLAVTTNSATNNIVMVYDRNGEWQKYIGINADTMGQYSSSLYFGNSTGIYQTEQGYSDAGADILSYYKTKDFVPSSPDIPSMFNYTYLTTDQSDGTLTTSFCIDGSTVPVTMGSYQMNQQPGLLQNFRVPFSNSDVTQGNFINLKWQISGTDFWRIANCNVYFDKGYVPTGLK